MKITVKELSAADLETFYRKAQRTRSPNTVIKFHANIRESLQWGIRHGYVLTNVADVAEKPKKEPFLPHFYNLDKMKKLLGEVRGTQLEFAVVMACHYGLRREEIVGLKWDAIDFQYKQIEIKHIVTEAVVDGHYQQISLDRAKTEKSLRTLPLLPSVEDLLLRMKTQQEDFEKIYGARYDHSFDGYIYLWPNGKRVKPTWVTHAFHRFLKETDPDNLIRFHDLRHSCATLMRHEGVPMEDIQKWLGHSTIVTTEGIYAHFDENGNIGSANKLAGAFGEKDVEEPKPSGGEMK
jgi:integrase